MSTVRNIYQKYAFGPSFPLRQGQDPLLEIHNHSRHTFNQYSKEGKTCQNGSSFVIPLTGLTGLNLTASCGSRCLN